MWGKSTKAAIVEEQSAVTVGIGPAGVSSVQMPWRRSCAAMPLGNSDLSTSLSQVTPLLLLT